MTLCAVTAFPKLNSRKKKTMQILRRLGGSYMRALETRPILTKSVTSAAIMFGGDSIQQGIERYAVLEKHRKVGFLHPSSSPSSALTHSRTFTTP